MSQNWTPPAAITRDETIARSNAVLALPDIPLDIREDIFRVEALGLDGVDDGGRRARVQHHHREPVGDLRVAGGDGVQHRRDQHGQVFLAVGVGASHAVAEVVAETELLGFE